ncbi:hypothetical protein L3X38_013899 [Prunus dulcis]|uniref:Uncharacterized protein n=1 Tax=Prunus dulcis TaxID=3755 RepID=A0AAD4WM76_PRUDU|nr:hypothetical protein L3X38_013899 [Prunus dulcis]
MPRLKVNPKSFRIYRGIYRLPTKHGTVSIGTRTLGIIARFGKQEATPREFFTDFVKVAQDEGRHFTLLAARLEEMGSFYGALPAHDGLWASAAATSKDLTAPLAVEHCMHEARSLDVLPTNISRFRNGVSDDEEDEVIKKFHAIVVRSYFQGGFEASGFGPRWYEPLAVKDQGTNPTQHEGA